MNALAGSCIPIAAMGLAFTACKQLSFCSWRRLWTFVVLVGLFTATDGLFVVESRYGLLNVYMVLLGLLSQWLWLLKDGANWQRGVMLTILSGVCLGCAIAVKWNGLGFALSLLIWEIIRGRKLSSFCLLIIFSILTYAAVWLPHLRLTEATFGSVHASLFSFHRALSADGHAACSRWFTWPLLIKPITYWYEKKGATAYTVNNMGNPALWWFSSAVMLLSFDRLREMGDSLFRKCRLPLLERNLLHTFFVVCYCSNLLPWVVVRRCTFVYLYMPAAVFGFMGFAWVVSGWLYHPSASVRWMGWMICVVTAVAFWFWLPLSIGSPLSESALQARWWLRSWI